MVGLMWLTTPGNRAFWIGLQGGISGSEFVGQWVDNTPWDPDNVVWEQDPNDWDGKSLCTFIWREGSYHAYVCGGFNYICQKNAGGTSGPSNKCPFGWRERDGYCYFFSPRDAQYRLSWDDARDACQAQDLTGDLVSVTNSDESEWLADQVGLIWMDDGRYPGYWTGLNDLPNGNKGPYKWSDGSRFNKDLIRWNSHPNTFGDAQCAAINMQGAYQVMGCRARFSQICESGSGPFAGAQTGMSSGQKAGIAIGVIVLIVLLAVAALFIYKMRTGPRPPRAGTGPFANALYGN